MEYERIEAHIDLDALERNFDALTGCLPSGTKAAPVIKADAYGHGALAVAKALALRTSYLAIADIHEGIALRQSGIRSPLLLLGGVAKEQGQAVVTYDLTPAVFRLETAEALSAMAGHMGKRVKIHLAVDTGMARIGFPPTEEGAREAARAASLPYIEAEGIFSHYADADGEDPAFSERQEASFCRFEELLRSYGITFPLCHMDNSAGMLTRTRHFDMARLGIGLYGVYPSAYTEEVYGKRVPLLPVLSLFSHITEIKAIPKGTSVGYGRAYIAEKDMRVATVSAGYGDGYPYLPNGGGEVLIGGRRCAVLGRVCMDMLMADVTGVPAAVGDKVILIGQDGGEKITAASLAGQAGTIPYAVLCGIARRVPRIYCRKGKMVEKVSYL